MTDAQLKAAASEAARRGLVEIELGDVDPHTLAEALMANPEGRRWFMTLLVRRRKSSGQKAVPAATVEAMKKDRVQGVTQPAIAKKHGVSLRTVARYTKGVMPGSQIVSG